MVPPLPSRGFRLPLAVQDDGPRMTPPDGLAEAAVEGRRQQYDQQQQAIPEPVSTVLEQLDILKIGGFK